MTVWLVGVRAHSARGSIGRRSTRRMRRSCGRGGRGRKETAPSLDKKGSESTTERQCLRATKLRQCQQREAAATECKETVRRCRLSAHGGGEACPAAPACPILPASCLPRPAPCPSPSAPPALPRGFRHAPVRQTRRRAHVAMVRGNGETGCMRLHAGCMRLYIQPYAAACWVSAEGGGRRDGGLSGVEPLGHEVEGDRDPL